MRPLTPRETALAAYFYAISTDPRVRAAGFSLAKFKDAILACVAEDVPAVAMLALRGKAEEVEPTVRRVTRDATATVLGGTVSPEVAGHIGETMDALVKDGFSYLKQKLAGKRA